MKENKWLQNTTCDSEMITSSCEKQQKKRREVNEKLQKMMKKVAFCMAFALVLCLISMGNAYATEADDGETEVTSGEDDGRTTPSDSTKVTVTIDAKSSHLGVRFYYDSNDVNGDNFEWIDPSTAGTYEVAKGATVRMRIYIRGDGYCVPGDYSISGATKVTDDSSVNFGWCRAAFDMTINENTTIMIPDGEVCKHPDADPSVRWGYYNCGDGKHVQSCTLCGADIPGTLGEHTLKEMTPAEYADWYYNDDNFVGDSEEWIAEQKANLTKIWCDKLGITADTKARFCMICEYGGKIADADNSNSGNNSSADNSSASSSSSTSSSQPTPTPAPAPTPAPVAEVPAAQPVAAGLADASGVLPEGATIAAATVISGASYEKAVEVIKAQVSGLGEFSVMEINLTDAANTQVHQLNGYVQVSVPMPANITVKEGKAIVVYRLEDDGTLTRCDTTVENGVITFKTNHFSTYIVAEEDVTAVTSPKTEDVSAGINLIFCMGILLAGAAAVAMKRKMA